MKVLVAEDTKANLLYLSACIEEDGHEVVTATNGHEAIAQFDKESPDLVLLDVVMPEMDGIKAAKEIRHRTIKSEQWIPIIFISAMNNDEDVVKGLETGGDDYIVKPVSQPVLKAKLNAMERIYIMQNALDAANQRLRMLSERDPLTGLANRRKFDEHMLREWKRSIRNSVPLSFCLIDVDHFKAFNDNYGHSVGDEALIKIGNCLGKCVKRPGDLVARYGGEEFALILPETDLRGTKVILDKVRNAIIELGIKHEFSSTENVVTISSGSMTVIPQKSDTLDDMNRLIVSADEALYAAKESGRNNTVSYHLDKEETVQAVS